MSNPYLIEGPALISFSGGRTSGDMLYQIVQAHGGKLPDDVVVAFANTGKEREETLRFVHECGSRWGVDSEGKLRAIIRDNPGVEGWWIEQEAGGKRFERARSYADLAAATHAQPLLPLGDDEHDAECGLWCAPDQEAA